MAINAPSPTARALAEAAEALLNWPLNDAVLPEARDTLRAALAAFRAEEIGKINIDGEWITPELARSLLNRGKVILDQEMKLLFSPSPQTSASSAKTDP